jgi:hypothetical protein
MITIKNSDYHILQVHNLFRINQSVLDNINNKFNYHKSIKHLDTNIDLLKNKPSLGKYYTKASVIIWCNQDNAIDLEKKYNSYTKVYQNGSTNNEPAFESVEVIKFSDDSLSKKIEKIKKMMIKRKKII